YFFYFKFILPVIGRLVSRDQAAYTYLPDSVNEFPYGKAFLELMTKAGFEQTQAKKLTFGIATLYKGIKAAR
ncbi:MAG TPA: class I SAM-dependent methyltransferase, partial [Bacteroidales bacterium]|nr:class I SAM-dependent methyltransferase [Bacteroidales bacterium]